MTAARDPYGSPIVIGRKADLPDGGTVTVTAVTEGIEYGAPVWYVTGLTSLGTQITRWIVK